MLKQASANNALYWSNVIVSLYLLIIVFLIDKMIYTLGKFESLWFPLGAALIQMTIFKFNQFYQIKQLKLYFKEFPKIIIVLVAIFHVYYTIAVILGAPLWDNVEGTSMFALMMTILTALPICLHFGPETTASMFTSIVSPYEEHVAQMAHLRLTLLGAWAGAAVIPLDWGRKWQDWPIPCYLGAIVGFTVGSTISKFYQKFSKQRRILL